MSFSPITPLAEKVPEAEIPSRFAHISAVMISSAGGVALAGVGSASMTQVRNKTRTKDILVFIFLSFST
jgi:hypothetical protein